jgi:hypothetical protein
MSSSRRALLLAALCTPLLAASLRAEKPSDSRSNSRLNTGETMPEIPNKIGGKTYDDWRKDLDHRDPSVRAAAIRVIPSFGIKAETAVPRLAEIATRDPDASPRAKAVIAFQYMAIRGTDRQRVVEALGTIISHDGQAIVRYEAARALTRFGADGREVVADLVRGVGDRSTFELREACIMALIVAGVDPKKGPDARVTDALILRSKAGIEPTAQVRLEAIIALGAMGRPQNPAKLNQVYGALEQNCSPQQNKVIRIWAHVSIMALKDTVDKKYLDIIAKYLDPKETRETRVQAVTALGALQSKSQDYLPNILNLFRVREDEEVMIAACKALGNMGNRGPRVIQTLVNQTEKTGIENVPIVVAAASALAKLGVTDAEATAALNKLLQEGGILNTQQKATLRLAIEDGKKARIDDDAKPKKARTEERKLNTGVTGAPKKTR